MIGVLIFSIVLYKHPG